MIKKGHYYLISFQKDKDDYFLIHMLQVQIELFHAAKTVVESQKSDCMINFM